MNIDILAYDELLQQLYNAPFRINNKNYLSIDEYLKICQPLYNTEVCEIIHTNERTVFFLKYVGIDAIFYQNNNIKTKILSIKRDILIQKITENDDMSAKILINIRKKNDIIKNVIRNGDINDLYFLERIGGVFTSCDTQYAKINQCNEHIVNFISFRMIK